MPGPTIDFSLTLTPQLRDIAGRFARAEGETLDLRRRQMEFLKDRIVALEKAEAPKRTGEFANAIKGHVFLDGKQLTMTTGSPQPLGTWIREGTKPHVISARPGGVLAFPWDRGPQGPGVYFFKQVNHPGTQPNDYVKRAFDRWFPFAQEATRRMALDIADFMVKQ